MSGSCNGISWPGWWGLHRVTETVEIPASGCVLSMVTASDSLSDEQCLMRAQRGDLDAFSELVRRYQNKIHRYVLRSIGCPEDARDITQDTFVRVFNQLDRWRPKAQFRTWLFRIASNAVIDHLRKRRTWRHVSIDEVSDTLDHDTDLGVQLDTNARFSRMVRALNDLSPIFRQTLLLRELEGMSYANIGEVLSISEGTVKSRIARARRTLLAQVDSGEGQEGNDDGSR